jgi:hypothetical protein
LLYDTFEAMDDNTSNVLQAYFAAYAVAVRYAIAKKTRQVLREGEGGESGTTYPDIPQSMTLQDFEHQIEIVSKVSLDDSPLDAITLANELEGKKRESGIDN